MILICFSSIKYFTLSNSPFVEASKIFFLDIFFSFLKIFYHFSISKKKRSFSRNFSSSFTLHPPQTQSKNTTINKQTKRKNKKRVRKTKPTKERKRKRKKESKMSGFGRVRDREPGMIDGWGFGIVIVIGGQFIGWNEGLQSGFGSFFVSTLLLGVAFFFLVLCLAEISSALPFPGQQILLLLSFSPLLLLSFLSFLSFFLFHLIFFLPPFFSLLSFCRCWFWLNKNCFRTLFWIYYWYNGIIGIYFICCCNGFNSWRFNN